MFWQGAQALNAIHKKQALLRDTSSQSAASVIASLLCLGRLRSGGVFLSCLLCGFGHLLLDWGRPYRLSPCNKLFHCRMIRIHTSRIDTLLCGAVRNPNRSPVSRPAGRIRFRGSAEENPVFPVHNLKIVDDHTAKIDAGKADQLPLRFNPRSEQPPLARRHLSAFLPPRQC